jgi:dihydrofolate reductase
MPKLRVHGFSISLDGYGAGPKQDRDDPLGVGGEALHDWFVATRTFQQRAGRDSGATGIDEDFVARGFTNIGAFIMGRNMLGPVRGPWPDDSWKGWWGNNPPYHALSSCSLTTPGHRLSWTAASPMVFTLHCDGPPSCQW